jgi:hypothetical protein
MEAMQRREREVGLTSTKKPEADQIEDAVTPTIAGAGETCQEDSLETPRSWVALYTNL